MRQSHRFAVISALSLALAACGAPEEEVEEVGAGIDEVGTEVDDLGTDEALADGEVITRDGDEPGEVETSAATPMPARTATPTPTPTRTAAPAPAPVTAMAPPASFAQCSVCHSVERGENGIGPTLAGVAGRRAGAVPGFSYSPAMRSANLTWNDANLNRYLADPAGVVPGTTMAIPGIPAGERTAIINYLKTL